MDSQNNNLYNVFLGLCKEIYNPKEGTIHLNGVNKDIKSIFNYAYKNRLVHHLALNYKDKFKGDNKSYISTFVSEYNNYKKAIRDSITIIKEYMKEQPFIIIKTFSSYPHLTNDIDVVVENENIAKNLNKKLLKYKGIFPVDVNTEISWRGADAISNGFIWRNIEKFSFEGISFFVPNPQLDVLIRMAHVPFELAVVRLGELLHIYRQISFSSVDISNLKREVELMNWRKTFNKMLYIFDILHFSLFDTPFFAKLRYHSLAFSSSGKIEFPYRVPISILIQGVVEKKAWKKISGARFLIKDWFLEWVDRNIL
ncbi:MAG: hypothetical protein J7J51_05835 [Candidatus Omnitrophica bacterium]|nr:hypothetical protein [Candidatus Omnitrophota bacterium]